MKLKKYNILTNREQIESLDKLLKASSYSRFAIDTETNGLKFWRDLVIGISLSFDSKSGFYIPFLSWEADETSKKIRKIDKVTTEVFENGHFKCVWTGAIYPESVTNKEYTYPEFIVDYLRSWLAGSNTQIIMHNATFDVLMIEHSLGINLQDNVYCDTMLLKHALDENSSNGLKETAILWSHLLNIPVEREANQEQIEMGRSVIRNGGSWKKTAKHVWRGDLELVGKYAASDTFLTYGLFEVGIDKLLVEYEQKHFEWFFEDEVMPLCREVVIPMRRHGVRIDVDYFREMEAETLSKMHELEEIIIKEMSPYIQDFAIGASIDEIATKKAVIAKIIEKEQLKYPTKTDKAGNVKNTLEKKAVQKVWEETNHWLWGYLLNEAEMEYSPQELTALKHEIYKDKTGKLQQFNISSDAHLRWLFCDKLKYSKTELPQTDSATKGNPIPSMKAEVLKQFFLKDHSFVKPLLLHKKLQKLHSTYILPALDLHNNGYLHMDMMQAGTVSGRFACRGGFNLQTLPKVEELDRCFKCGSKDIIVIHPIRLVAVMACNGCGHVEEDIICPSAIKAGFIAPEGYKIVNADYSSLEPRCFAFVSNELKIKDVYFKNLDFYSKVYCDIEDPKGKYSADPKAPNFLKKVANHLRTMVKPVVLGIPYGALAPQTARLMNFKKIDMRSGKEVLDVERGKEFRDKYLNTYPNLKRYMEGQVIKACDLGYVETLVGRRRHFKFTKPVYKLLCRANSSVDEFLEISKKTLDKTQLDEKIFTHEALKLLGKQCGFNLRDEKGVERTWVFIRAMFKNEINGSFNTPIQGLAAHITNMAMLDTNRELQLCGLDAYVCLTVHDEVTLYAKEEDAEAAAVVLQHCMEKNQYTKLVDVPMIAEPIICDNLKDSK